MQSFILSVEDLDFVGGGSLTIPIGMRCADTPAGETRNEKKSHINENYDINCHHHHQHRFTGTGSSGFMETGDGVECRTSNTLVHAELVLVVAERTGRTTCTARLVVTVLVLYVSTGCTRNCTVHTQRYKHQLAL